MMHSLRGVCVLSGFSSDCEDGSGSFVSAVALRSLEYLLGRKPYRAERVLHWIAARHYPHFTTFQYVSHSATHNT